MKTLIAVAMLLSGCAFAHYDRINNMHGALARQLRAFDAESPKNCKSGYLSWAWQNAVDIGGMSFGPQSANILRISSSSAVLVADTALSAKCLDEADYFYREILKIYTGLMFTAERQRAQIGIDDIRAARK